MNTTTADRSSHILAAAMWLALSSATVVPGALAQMAPPPGYIYSRHVMASLTQSCLAPAPGGSFVGIGQGFTANAQAVVLAKESGELRLVAFGFNSIADCAYDRTRDVLYVSDNAGEDELPGATTGDTVFAIPSASTATGLPAASLALLPAGALPAAASLAVDGNGDLLAGNAAGGTAGTVSRVDLGPPAMAMPFAGGFAFTGGLAVDAVSGDVWVAETLSTSESQIRRLDAAGTSLGVFAGPSFGFGSIDLAFNTDGSLLATGAFSGGVASFDASGAQSPFVSGLAFTTGIAVDAFTGRVEILSSTFLGAEEDRSIHRFTPVDRLVTGNGSKASECALELYGLELPSAAGKGARTATCVDGAACDGDGIANDRCLFPVGFCLDVPDPRLSGCLPAAVVDFSVTTKPASAAVAATAAGIEQALPVAAPSCFFSDGILVPVATGVRGRSAGRAVVRTKATLANGKKDRDAVTLLCKPA
jgi:hypothetical protein